MHSVQVYHLFSNFLFTYLFSIKYLLFFFSYFNLFVSIFVQSYVNRNLQVSIIYILIIHKANNSKTFKCVHLLASVAFNAPYFHYTIQTIGHVSIPKRHLFSPLCLFCAYDSSVLQNFKMFTHLLLNFSYSTLPLTEVEFESGVDCNYSNNRARKVRKPFPEGCRTKSGIVFRYCKTNILQLLFDNCSDVTIILLSLLSSFRRYYHHQMTLLSSFICVTFVLTVFQRRFSVHKSSMQDKITHDRICC